MPPKQQPEIKTSAIESLPRAFRDALRRHSLGYIFGIIEITERAKDAVNNTFNGSEKRKGRHKIRKKILDGISGTAKASRGVIIISHASFNPETADIRPLMDVHDKFTKVFSIENIPKAEFKEEEKFNKVFGEEYPNLERFLRVMPSAANPAVHGAAVSSVVAGTGTTSSSSSSAVVARGISLVSGNTRHSSSSSVDAARGISLVSGNTSHSSSWSVDAARGIALVSGNTSHSSSSSVDAARGIALVSGNTSHSSSSSVDAADITLASGSISHSSSSSAATSYAAIAASTATLPPLVPSRVQLTQGDLGKHRRSRNSYGDALGHATKRTRFSMFASLADALPPSVTGTSTAAAATTAAATTAAATTATSTTAPTATSESQFSAVNTDTPKSFCHSEDDDVEKFCTSVFTGIGDSEHETSDIAWATESKNERTKAPIALSPSANVSKMGMLASSLTETYTYGFEDDRAAAYDYERDDHTGFWASALAEIKDSQQKPDAAPVAAESKDESTEVPIALPPSANVSKLES